jgi:hypothetical protein
MDFQKHCPEYIVEKLSAGWLLGFFNLNSAQLL